MSAATRTLSVAWLLTPASAVAAARTWKTADGAKTTEAEFVSTKDGEVTIRRAGLSMHEWLNA